MTEELGAEAGIIATARIETSAESHTPSPAFMNLSVNEEFSDAKPMSAHWIYRWTDMFFYILIMALLVVSSIGGLVTLSTTGTDILRYEPEEFVDYDGIYGNTSINEVAQNEASVYNFYSDKDRSRYGGKRLNMLHSIVQRTLRIDPNAYLLHVRLREDVKWRR
ncbi:hypothetical protein BDV29DRAFT_154567 [Aspergillus leporis]|uniref:Uncharacterized protein n=1 Tax=Aspergillus leporis TaxID=41062 RepID=A0A5N5X909_9EURO|nr:hypothetical protein BDV29DRAFT_154567 [Aspergillus leporis]